jgi:hypothetical protein
MIPTEQTRIVYFSEDVNAGFDVLGGLGGSLGKRDQSPSSGRDQSPSTQNSQEDYNISEIGTERGVTSGTTPGARSAMNKCVA